MRPTDRRLGALFGAAVGDALGLTHEFKTPEQIPSGRFVMVGGGPFGFAPGAASDDTDLLLVALRAYPERNKFEPELALEGMLEWLAGEPRDVGMQTRASLASWGSGKQPADDKAAQGNGGLMRAAAHSLACDNSRTAAQFARTDTRLTHPSDIAAEVSAFFASVLWRALDGQNPQDAISGAGEDAHTWQHYDVPGEAMSGWCVHSLRLALWALTAAESYESGIDAVIRTGGDTDTNASISGALLGARFGIQEIPPDWIAGLEAGNRERLNREVDRLL